MKRLDGFIDLNSLLGSDIENLRKNGILQDMIKDLDIGKYIITMGEKDYFLKKCSYQRAITELIVNEMLDYAKIRNIKYDLACIDGNYGVISKSFKKEGFQYFDGIEILKEYRENLKNEIDETKDKEFRKVLEEEYQNIKHSSGNQLEVIWHALEWHFRDFENKDNLVFKIMRQLNITHMKDMLILNQDRNASNWVIEQNEKDANLVPDFDHEQTFRDDKWSALHINPFGEKYMCDNNYQEFEKFIKYSDESTYNVLLYLKSKLGINNLEIAIKKVEKKIGVSIREDTKEDIRRNFKRHQIRINDILEKDEER